MSNNNAQLFQLKNRVSLCNRWSLSLRQCSGRRLGQVSFLLVDLVDNCFEAGQLFIRSAVLLCQHWLLLHRSLPMLIGNKVEGACREEFHLLSSFSICF